MRCDRVDVPEPRGHHLVAKLYQKGFARKSKKVWQVSVTDRSNGRTTLRNIENTLKRRDWNTVKTEEGELDFAIETVFADHVDGPAAPVIAALREGDFPAGRPAGVALATFMAAQLTRGSIVRENLREFVERLSRHVLRLAAQNYTDAHWKRAIGEVPNPGVVAALLDNENHIELNPTNGLLLDALLSPVDEMAELLARRTWTLVAFDKPSLFTGGHPVVHVTGAEGGYGVVNAEMFHFPVSPERTLLLSHPWSSWPEGTVRGSRRLAEQLNWATLVHPANVEILAHPDVAGHPLPSLATFRKGSFRWPWPPDPGASPPPSLEYLEIAQRRGAHLASER
jgi:Protein of unknown function (DUF4238)